MYCSRKDIERAYGKNNVGRWADLDSNKDTEEIEDRIQYQIVQAGNEVDGDLSQSPYGTPFEEPYPDVIVYLCALKAGILLYMGRRIASDDLQNQVSQQQKHYQELVNKINADRFKILNVARRSTKPIKVVPNDDEETGNGFEDYYSGQPCRENG